MSAHATVAASAITVDAIRERPLRRIDAAGFAGDAAEFYARHLDGPAIVRGAMAAELTLERVAGALAGGVIEGYSRDTGERETLAADAFFAALGAGRCRHNVLDHPLRGTPLGRETSPPAFARSNWVPTDRPELGISPLSLTVSPAGSFTELHVDSYGMQGWMALARGAKRWTFVAPDAARARTDPVTGAIRWADCSSNDVVRYVGVARVGDLVYVPPGWAHEVATLETSVGVGGSVINQHALVATMQSWLFERAIGWSDELDVAALARAAAPDVDDVRGRAALAEALALYAAWCDPPHS